jgi:hypothetical protein
MLDKKKTTKPDLKSEMDELQRVVQDLSRDENIETTVDKLVDAFNNSKETTLTSDIWEKLENTESNDIEKGDMKAVHKIAKMYNKTNPEKLSQSFTRGDYKRPLIVKFGDRYHLVAGNTRLCTAAALGINPNVFIAKINTINENEKLKNGDSDNLTLLDLAKKHSYDDSKDSTNHKNIDKMLELLKQQLDKGIKVEMEHTEDVKVAKEITMDHLSEDPMYYDKLKKMETKEETGADSSGSFSGPAFGGVILKKDLYKLHNTKKYNMNEEEVEFKEATDASSSGSYDVPLFGKTSKGRRDPLRIDGEKSIKQSRAVKDKKFPKWGGPDSVFVKVKDKCKKFPYCNQGDINSIELLEIEELNESISEISKELGVPYKEIEKIVLNEIKQIFI